MRSPNKVARLIGTAKTPALIDVRTDKDFAYGHARCIAVLSA
jgi:hypothetical protein